MEQSQLILPKNQIKRLQQMISATQTLQIHHDQLIQDREKLIHTLQKYKAKNQALSLELATANSKSNKVDALQSEIDQLKEENKSLKASLTVSETEMASLKVDIDNFKEWTKKLDWSTADIPEELKRLYDIKQVEGVMVPSSHSKRITNIMSGQQVNGVWHGKVKITETRTGVVHQENRMNGQLHGERTAVFKGSWPGAQKNHFWMGKNLNKVIKENTDGGKMYLCTDENNHGVSVLVLGEANRQIHKRFAVKNGYQIRICNYNDEPKVELWEVKDHNLVKWYQLKK